MCGIWSYIGNDFNSYKFNVLGLYNDTRGGDSCGIFYKNVKHENVVRYGHGDTKLYKRFIETHSVDYKDMGNSKFIMGHCRKASVGGIGLERAQPVLVKNEMGIVDFAMIHNGTLLNYKELAKKYDVNFTHDETDSQIFARIVYKAGFQVLKEYDGAGAFIFYDDREGNGLVHVFKGASLYYENDKLSYEERPLYWLRNKKSIYISSMEESLQFICDSDDDKITDIKCNTLYTLSDIKIVSTKYYNRAERKSVDKLVYDWKRNNNRNYNNNNEIPFHQNAPVLYNTNKLLVHQVYPNRIGYRQDGRYYNGENKAHGEFKLSKYGYIQGATAYSGVTYTSVDYTCYFVYGILMASYYDYLCALEYLESYEVDDRSLEIGLSPFAYEPVPIYNSEEDEKNGILTFYTFDNTTKEFVTYDGVFNPLFEFTVDSYTIIDGSITQRKIMPSNYDEVISYNKNVALSKTILKGEWSKEKLQQQIEKTLDKIFCSNEQEN